MKVFPVFFNDLTERRCVVVGGDHEAERKVGDLLEVDAPVTVIAPTLTRALAQQAETGTFQWIARDYEPGDLTDAFLVIVTETNPEKTAPIWEEAQEKKVLINAMDDVPHCSFVSGSVIRRGPLVVSVSTSGAAPALSVRIRQKLENEFGPEYGELLELLGALRGPMAERYPDFEERRRRWYELVDADLLALLRADDREAVRRRVEALTGIHPKTESTSPPVREGHSNQESTP